jgi:hypothetical protein
MAKPLQAAWSALPQTSSFLPDSKHIAASVCALAIARWRSMSTLRSLSPCVSAAKATFETDINTKETTVKKLLNIEILQESYKKQSKQKNQDFNND